jgi:hypothetical protein
MYAVGFQAQIKNGTIEIPEAYRSRFKEHMRVILLAEEDSPTVTLIDQLLQYPSKCQGSSRLPEKRCMSVPDAEPGAALSTPTSGSMRLSKGTIPKKPSVPRRSWKQAVQS